MSQCVMHTSILIDPFDTDDITLTTAGWGTNIFKRVTEDICTEKSDKAHFLPPLINPAECIVAGCIPKFILNVYLYIALARI